MEVPTFFTTITRTNISQKKWLQTIQLRPLSEPDLIITCTRSYQIIFKRTKQKKSGEKFSRGIKG